VVPPVTGSRLVSRLVLHNAAVDAAGAGAACAGGVTAWHLRGGPVRAPTGDPVIVSVRRCLVN
jgi:hypothetical protein